MILLPKVLSEKEEAVLGHALPSLLDRPLSGLNAGCAGSTYVTHATSLFPAGNFTVRMQGLSEQGNPSIQAVEEAAQKSPQ